MNECKHPAGKCNNADDCAEHICAQPKQMGTMALMRGVRVDGESVVISVRGGNEAARKLCGELVLLVDQEADPIARHLATKVADHWRNECMRLRAILAAPLTDEQIDALAMDEDGLPNSHLELARAVERAHGIGTKTPCGECHLQPGERCDICGARDVRG